MDALVNNAGVAIFKPIGETSFEEWSLVLGTNFNGVFLCTQAIAPLMLQRGGGAIVNISSISGLRASTLRVAYGTSKAAVIHLTKQQASELGTVGIRVNAVAPGPVDTDMAKLVHSVAIRADYHDVIPLNRYGTVDNRRRRRLSVQRRGQLRQRPGTGGRRRLRGNRRRTANPAARRRQEGHRRHGHRVARAALQSFTIQAQPTSREDPEGRQLQVARAEVLSDMWRARCLNPAEGARRPH